MAELKKYREVGIFDLLSAPLNPIGAFDAEQFKKDVHQLLEQKPDERFLAVDLLGLDFVYSDAYNAFLQFQEEMSKNGGMFALLADNKMILDGLKKAGLDKKFKIFALEADMMSFSLQSQPEAPAPVMVTSQNVSIPAKPQAVPSQNVRGDADDTTTILQPLTHSSGAPRRFTKSFNAIPKDELNPQKGLDDPFGEEPSSSHTILIVVILLLVAAGAAVAYFYLK